MFMRGEGDTWLYILADKLHKTVGEVLAMPNNEIVGWASYFQVKDVLTDLARRTEEHRR